LQITESPAFFFRKLVFLGDEMTAQGLSRRTLLKALGAGALTWGMAEPLLRRVHAQQFADELPSPSAFMRRTMGDAEVTIIQDGDLYFDGAFLATNADPDEIYALLEANFLPRLAHPIINVTVAKLGERLVLLDSGQGSLITDRSAPPTGRLVPTLALLGITPESITDVFISHFHPDHMGGISDGDTMTFPNATYHVPQGDYDLMLQGSSGSANIDSQLRTAKALLAPMEGMGQISVYDNETEAEVVSGVTIIPTKGHTVGHASFLIHSGDQSLLNITDAAVHPIVSLANPNYHLASDSLPELAAESRATLLERLASERQQIIGYHFPFPGVGYAVKDGAGYRFVGSA
jgi:glyoxylase-like metal-dependent hydrolase (beta-lactamase superfamily II)